jgi:hypothetical protein
VRDKVTLSVFRDLFRRLGISALWYAGVFAVVILVLQIVFKAAGVDGDVALTVISAISTRFYMLVLGIVCPLVYFTHYLAVGVTRKQFAVGIFAAGALLSLCFALLRAPMLIIENVFSPLALLVPALYGALAFLVGWTAAVGFQYMRGVPICVGTICAAAMFHGMIAVERLQLPLSAHLPISAGAIALVGAVLLVAVQRIPVKC